MTADATFGAMAAILAMSGVTILLRVSGFYLMGFVVIGPRIEAAFRAIPGAVAAATFTPLVMRDGVSAFVALLIAALVARLGRGDLFALVAGMSSAVLLRKAGL
jgi:uncharacterized membrane protein